MNACQNSLTLGLSLQIFVVNFRRSESRVSCFLSLIAIPQPTFKALVSPTCGKQNHCNPKSSVMNPMSSHFLGRILVLNLELQLCKIKVSKR